MSTLILHPAGRETAKWAIPSTDGSEGLQVSFDNGYEWHPLAYVDGEWTLEVQGPRADGQAQALRLAAGIHGALIRATPSGQIVLREGGAIYVQTECDPWPVDWSTCGGPPEDPDIRERAEHMAVSTLRGLTLDRVGGCPITVRPCARGCYGSLPRGNWYAGPSSTFYPHLNGAGQWVNSCGCGAGCHCGKAMPTVVLEGPVGRLDEVWVHGELLDPSAYRLDDGVRLVRLDGEGWPSCQDMSQPHTGPDAFAVTYLNAYPVSFMGAIAAGVLAREYAQACAGKSCRLPAGVTQIVRLGTTMTIASDLFASGLTGIREVDTFTAQFNPNRVRTRPQVYSPDLMRHRRVGS